MYQRRLRLGNYDLLVVLVGLGTRQHLVSPIQAGFDFRAALNLKPLPPDVLDALHRYAVSGMPGNDSPEARIWDGYTLCGQRGWRALTLEDEDRLGFSFPHPQTDYVSSSHVVQCLRCRLRLEQGGGVYGFMRDSETRPVQDEVDPDMLGGMDSDVEWIDVERGSHILVRMNGVHAAAYQQWLKHHDLKLFALPLVNPEDPQLHGVTIREQ